MEQLISPHHILDTRLYDESSLWVRWRPVSLQVSVSCSGASTTFGSIVVGWSSDPYFTLVGDARDYPRVASLRPSMVLRLHESKTLTIPVETTRRWYSRVGSYEDAIHGILVAVVASPIGGFDKGSIGINVSLKWRCQFEGPNLGLAARTSHTIQPDAGWSGLFTTSDGGFSATTLTFKESSGGSMVPFSSARAGYIYKPSKDTKVQYYDSANLLVDLKYLTLVKGYSTPGLVFHTSEDKAKSYIKTGDLTDCVSYVKAGPTGTPSRPTFVGTPVDSADELEGFQIVPPLEGGGSLEEQVHRLTRLVGELSARLRDRPATS